MFDLENWLPWIERESIWIVQVFIVVLITAVVSFFAKRLLARIHKKLYRTPTRWDEIVFGAMMRPVTWIIWLAGLDIAVEIIYAETQSTIFTYSDSVRDVGVLVCITWFVLGIIRGAEQEFGQESDRVDKHTVLAIGKLVRLAVIITAALVILQTLGFSVSGVLAMGGIGGIAVGFAAKDLLANFFGGLIIYFDRPFVIGDWIRSPDRDIEGTVENIGWRVTMIRDFQSRPLYVPNSVFTTIIVENPSRMANRRIYETIGLRYSDLTSMDKVVAEVEAMLRSHDEIDSDKTLMVNFNEFSDSSVDFFIYCFTRTTLWGKFHQVKQDVMLRIADIVEANNAEIAFPTSTIHIGEPIAIDNS
ncbi:MAG: mechanosensitive ion channel family protein [Gammaproteobacteria bacterium]|nr:mechanosensitive ion channel family protein [Gammaproteobacteria bacterium]MDH3857613.1 mechanosensitive ion channel family protein [Gammaproteobacteria bacterium]